jgi:hypothetical protein
VRHETAHQGVTTQVNAHSPGGGDSCLDSAHLARWSADPACLTYSFCRLFVLPVRGGRLDNMGNPACAAGVTWQVP